MHQHDPDTIDVIVGRSGREIDITFGLREIVHIGRHFYPDSTPHPDDRRIGLDANLRGRCGDSARSGR